jgi:hypothetical protein
MVFDAWLVCGGNGNSRPTGEVGAGVDSSKGSRKPPSRTTAFQPSERRKSEHENGPGLRVHQFEQETGGGEDEHGLSENMDRLRVHGRSLHGGGR